MPQEFLYKKEVGNFDNILEYKERMKLKDVIALIDGLILDNAFNSLTGPTKSGKSRAILDIIFQYARKHKVQVGIISTENDFECMLMHQIRVKAVEDYVKVVNPKIITTFKDGAKTAEMINEFLYRIKTVVKRHQFKILLIDPMPRFMDWNKERQVTKLIEGLNDLCKELKCCIVGIRNDGKAEDHSQIHKSKGSSALEDISRVTIRAIPVHKRSSIGKEKEIKGKKALILTSQFGNSLMKPEAKLFTIEVTEFNDVQNNIVNIPIACQQRKIEAWELDNIEFLCSIKSGLSVITQIVKVLTIHKELTMEEIYNLLPHLSKML